MEAPLVILIGCGKTKLPHAATAADLYTGALFKKRRAYVEAKGCPWFIVSALYGLLEPGQRIETYDKRLARKEAKEWGAKVVAELSARFPNGIGRLEIHAGADYVHGVRIAAPNAAEIVCPTAGKGIGQQLAFYSAAKQ